MDSEMALKMKKEMMELKRIHLKVQIDPRFNHLAVLSLEAAASRRQMRNR